LRGSSVTVKNILVVEDDVDVAQTVATALRANNYNVTLAHSGEDADQFLSFMNFDLLLLDCCLPERTGLDVCRKYRKSKGAARVLFLTGRNRIEDKLTGFEVGADDYLTKPFDLREMLMRVKVLLERDREEQPLELVHGDLKMDVLGKRLMRGNVEIKLAPREFSLLEFLMRNPGRFFKSQELILKVWPDQNEASEESVRVCVRRLRQALENAVTETKVVNVHSHGYKLE
jgi:DNA-binding response OmpR family regulator